jgi:hypothetical protein
MNVEEYGQLEMQLRINKVHFRQGVYWWQYKPFYCLPLHELQTIEPGESAPSPLRALLGYEHIVPDPSMANAVLPVMMVENVQDYSIDALSSNTRNHIRKGLRRTEVRLADLRDMQEHGYEVNLSALARQKEDWTRDTSAYSNRQKWFHDVEAYHGLPGKKMWGAYRDGRLIAYLWTTLVEDTAYINGAMGHSGYLGYHPNEALLYTFCSYCSETGDIARVVFGLWCAKESLNRFKEKMGFRKVDFPLFRKINPLVRWIIPFTYWAHYLYYKGEGERT